MARSTPSVADSPLVLVLYLAVGAVAGTLAGLFGVGGGVIIVPALVMSIFASYPPRCTVRDWWTSNSSG